MTRRTVVTAAAAAVTAALVASVAPAMAADGLAPRTTFSFAVNASDGTVALPDSGEGIPNVDSVKSTIRAYYAAPSGIANPTSSPYVSEVSGILGRIDAAYPALTGDAVGTKAIVFDADDTLLWNYDFEDKATNFNFDATANLAWITGAASCDKVNGSDYCFPAVPGTPALVRDLAAKGYRLYVVTGRPASQEAATIGNLTAAGFTEAGGTPLFDADNVYTKWNTQASNYDAATVPAYVQPANGGECTTFVDAAKTQFKCTTVEYKAQTRQHIESADHVEIVGNVGDQLSDLWGGYAEQAWKIPNPTYFLASPNLDAAHVGADDQSASLQPASTYTMKADGSSGLSVGGDQIPNIDPVRTEIRSWYAATNGIADKTSSHFLTELAGLTRTWTRSTADDCAAQTTAITKATAAKAAAGRAVTQATRAVARAQKKVAHAQKMVRKAKHSSAKQRRHRAQQLRAARRGLAKAKAALTTAQRKAAAIVVPNRPAITLDADDTTLWNYDMEDGVMKFAYTPAAAAEWVLGEKFPAEPGMIALVQKAKAAGCTVIGLTGRPMDQAAATVANLTKVGFVDSHGTPLFSAGLYFTKWPTGAATYDPKLVPSYINSANCSTYVDTAKTQFKCTTIEYKSQTRAHIERDLHYRIVGNFGDQYSDLIGGHAARSYKLPNPTYYLP
ncbi:HAD family acid phosphatase [Nocardioides sp.]|uniref:HAD family acid phosphatase n=1 Tax=Nocardioides sp. TaxID=35761 RepID=UPI00262DFD6C|nr:HAD family acid phosphatase [Nocardioides sp.]